MNNNSSVNTSGREWSTQWCYRGIASGQFINTPRKLPLPLRDKGFSRQDLLKLPKDDANALLGQARRYATLKLAEIEARARFRHKIRFEN
ncbi:MAG: hypothetical protein MUO62_02105 [Anaerolineales bacterium]|nr:hypothetical protein [Anaerolineales bacterium]